VSPFKELTRGSFLHEAGLSILRWAHQSQGGINPETGPSVPRRAYQSRGGTIGSETGPSTQHLDNFLSHRAPFPPRPPSQNPKPETRANHGVGGSDQYGKSEACISAAERKKRKLQGFELFNLKVRTRFWL
jgi:hypothetical protein